MPIIINKTRYRVSWDFEDGTTNTKVFTDRKEAHDFLKTLLGLPSTIGGSVKEIPQ